MLAYLFPPIDIDKRHTYEGITREDFKDILDRPYILQKNNQTMLFLFNGLIEFNRLDLMDELLTHPKVALFDQILDYWAKIEFTNPFSMMIDQHFCFLRYSIQDQVSWFEALWSLPICRTSFSNRASSPTYFRWCCIESGCIPLYLYLVLHKRLYPIKEDIDLLCCLYFKDKNTKAVQEAIEFLCEYDNNCVVWLFNNIFDRLDTKFHIPYLMDKLNLIEDHCLCSLLKRTLEHQELIQQTIGNLTYNKWYTKISQELNLIKDKVFFKL